MSLAGLGQCPALAAATFGAAGPDSQAKAPADEGLGADLKTITDPTAADDVILDAAVRLSESLDGPLPAETMEGLLRLTRHPDWNVRWRAMGTLGVLGPHAEAAVPELVRITPRSETGPRGVVRRFIGHARVRPDRTAPGPRGACDHGRPEILRRARAIGGRHLAGEVRPGRRAAVPALIRQIDDGDVPARESAVSVAWANRPGGAVGPARELLKRLDALMNSTDRFASAERAGVIEALGRIHAEAAVPVLTRMLDQGNPADQQVAAYALGRIGPPAKGALPQLEQVGGRPNLRLPVAFAFVRLGRADEGFRAWRPWRWTTPPHWKYSNAPAELGPSALPVLSDVIRSDSSNGRWAVQSVEKLGPGGKAAVPSLIEVIKSGPGKGSHRFKFDKTLVALGKLGAERATRSRHSNN